MALLILSSVELLSDKGQRVSLLICFALDIEDLGRCTLGCNHVQILVIKRAESVPCNEN